MYEWQSRTELLLGAEAVEKLKNASVAVFGLGGVGSYAFEALLRAGIGEFWLYDGDTVSLSNINRQLLATTKTVGEDKVEIARQRALEINPAVIIHAVKLFYLPENSASVNFNGLSYIVDAVDTVSAKIELVVRAKTARVPIISAMGTGNKLQPGAFKIGDIYDTRVCPLARVIRRELKKKGVDSLKVVYSEEEPTVRERVPASISFVPSVAGLLMASEVVKDIIAQEK